MQGTPQGKMKAQLESSGLPFHAIEVYGRQITVECVGRNTARKWETLLGRFVKVRGVVDTVVNCKSNKGTTIHPDIMAVYRVYATV